MKIALSVTKRDSWDVPDYEVEVLVAVVADDGFTLVYHLLQYNNFYGNDVFTDSECRVYDNIYGWDYLQETIV